MKNCRLARTPPRLIVLMVALLSGFQLTAPLTRVLLGQQIQTAPRVDMVQTLGGVVTSDSPAASRVGRDILQQGGNAVDAAVATALAMAVTWPEAGNIGGGGFMMIALPNSDQVVCVDYREKAPAAVHQNSYLTQKNRCDSRMVGVPGTVRGLALAQKQYGKLDWSTVVGPAIKLAREGFVVHDQLADSVNRALKSVKEQPMYAELTRVYGRVDGRDWRAGDVMKLPDLAATLQRMATEGPDEFYVGKTADLLSDYMKASGGWIVKEDLKNYEAKIRTSIRTEFRGYSVFGPPPPSSGGITVGMALNILDASGFTLAANQSIDGPRPDWSLDQAHVVAEAMRRAFRERAAHLGDPDFTSIPASVTDVQYARKLASTIDPNRATSSVAIAGDIRLTEGPYESPQTTHFSVIDESGMAVSNTYTLEASWGAKVIAPGTGIVLNNEMGDFNWYPGYTNLSGRIGTPANLVEPGKRMLSSMSPLIVKREDKVVLITGSPGGRTIINTSLEIVLQHLVLRRPIDQAVAATRFHHQWLPDRINIEPLVSVTCPGLVEGLRKRGHKVVVARSNQGSAHTIAINPDTNVRTGVSDWRRGGRVAVTR